MEYNPEIDSGRPYEPRPPSRTPPADDSVLKALGGQALLGAVTAEVDQLAVEAPLTGAAGSGGASPSTASALGATALSGAIGGTSQGGAGVSLGQAINEVITVKRALEDQMRMIDEFMRTNRETMEMVRTALAGGTKGYDAQMASKLAATESALVKSKQSLEQAATALARASMI